MEQKLDFNNKLATLVVDGVERELNAAVYGPGAVLVLTDAFETSPADFSGRGREPYRAALVVRNGSIQENMSVRPALVGGTVTDQAMEGVTVRSTTANFNHVIVENTEYTLRNCDLRADTDSNGKRVCDFNGYGSVVCAHKGAKLTIDHCHLFSRGVAKPVLFADGGANCLMKDSTYECMGGTLYAGYQNAAGFTKMVAPPWVLGITGSARGTNLMGALSTMTIVNCDCKANDWGVVSTDGGKELALYIVDSTLTLLGEGNMLDNPYVRRFGPGYGVYAAGCDEFIYGTELNVGTYAVISTGGSITMASSDRTVAPRQKYLVPTGQYRTGFGGRREEVQEVHWNEEPVFPPIAGKGRPTVVNSDGWGFLLHGDSRVSLLEGTICNTDYATFLIRAVGADIHVDRAVLNPGDGTILQMMDNDDKAVGGYFTPDIYDDAGNLIQPHMGPIFNHEFFEHPGWPGIDYHPVSKSNGKTVTAAFTNCTLKGDLWNATGYRPVNDGADGQGEALEVTLGAGAVLEGIVSSATAKHIDEKGRDNNLFTQQEYYYLGHVANRPFFNGVNPVRVTLEDGAAWTVTGECLLSALTIGAEAALLAPAGKQLTMTVDGEAVAPAPGCAYTGSIQLNITE